MCRKRDTFDSTRAQNCDTKFDSTHQLRPFLVEFQLSLRYNVLLEIRVYTSPCFKLILTNVYFISYSTLKIIPADPCQRTTERYWGLARLVHFPYPPSLTATGIWSNFPQLVFDTNFYVHLIVFIKIVTLLTLEGTQDINFVSWESNFFGSSGHIPM